MKPSVTCFACFLKQVKMIVDTLGVDKDKGIKFAKEVARYIAEVDEQLPPPVIAKRIYELAGDYLGKRDPYKKLKEKSIEAMKGLKAEFLKRLEGISNSFERLKLAMKFSASANAIDYGVSLEFDIDEIMSDLERVGIQDEDYLMENFKRGKKWMILGDNAGENVADSVVAGVLTERGCDVIYAVRGEPVLNDITLDDDLSDFNGVAKVITTGSGYSGLWKDASDGFWKQFYEVDVVISKGQGNFETIDELMKMGMVRRPVYFLLKVKCDPIAERLSQEVGTFVAKLVWPKV